MLKEITYYSSLLWLSLKYSHPDLFHNVLKYQKKDNLSADAGKTESHTNMNYLSCLVWYILKHLEFLQTFPTECSFLLVKTLEGERWRVRGEDR